MPAEPIAEKATYQDPHQFAVGVPTVIINGEPVVEGGEHNGTTPGRMLKRG